MKHLKLMLVLFACSSHLFAQYSKDAKAQINQQDSISISKTALILNFGPSFPSGDYADVEYGGAAKVGYALSVELQHALSDLFYVGIMYRNQRNRTDEVGLQASFAASLPPGLGVRSVRTGQWKLNNYMVGFGTMNDFSNSKLTLYTKIMLGFCRAYSPGLNVVVSDGQSQLSINQPSAESNTVAFLIGTGLRIKMAQSVDLMFSGDYFYTDLDMKNVKATAQGGATVSGSISQTVDALSLSLGLVFKL